MTDSKTIKANTIIYDLHSHTKASDGLLTPTELVMRAVEKGVSVLAITDHDTLDGLAAAQATIEQQGLPLQLINGVEISTVWRNRDIHVVGLNINCADHCLNTLLTQQRVSRQWRAEQIAARLEKAGISNALQGAQQIADSAPITRAHFARYLLQLGYAKSVAKIFNSYLAKGKIGYIAPQGCRLNEAITAIHHAGGLAILAHPTRYDLSVNGLKELVRDFCQEQGDGIEVALCQQTRDQRQLVTTLAKEYQLLASVGSDFHQPCNWIELGRNLWLGEELEPVWHHW